MLYRVLQELLSNVIRHAEANVLSVQLYAQEDSVLLMVEDNGKGMPPAAQKQDGVGWRNIRKRMSPFEASIVVDSHSQSGTSIIITVPITERLSPKGAPTNMS